METPKNPLDENEFYRSALVPTSKGKRIANYFIDLIGFYFFIFVGVIFGGAIMGLFNIHAARSFFQGLENKPNISDQIVTMLIYGLYMSLVEILFEGKSFGKFITKTRAISRDGSKPTVNQLVTRGFSRAVPFDGFSFLGESSTGWHDKWSDTMVVDDSALPPRKFS
jgi:uncharacterized RDD family membrane protein YckC